MKTCPLHGDSSPCTCTVSLPHILRSITLYSNSFRLSPSSPIELLTRPNSRTVLLLANTFARATFREISSVFVATSNRIKKRSHRATVSDVIVEEIHLKECEESTPIIDANVPFPPVRRDKLSTRLTLELSPSPSSDAMQGRERGPGRPAYLRLSQSASKQ